MIEFASFLVRLVLAAVVAVLVGFLDEPITGYQLAWWMCALIGFVVVFGGFLILVVADE